MADSVFLHQPLDVLRLRSEKQDLLGYSHKHGIGVVCVGEALHLPSISLKIQIIENAQDSNDATLLATLIQESSEISDSHKYSVNFCSADAGMIQARFLQ